MKDSDIDFFVYDDTNTNDKWFIPESKLDKNQRNVIDKFDNNLLVEGGAGSGKTILAIYKLARIINENLGTYTFIVYTVTLRNFIKGGIQQIGSLKDKLDNLKIYYKEEVEKLIKNNKFEKADYILIDEVQDLGRDFIEKMNKYAKKNIILFGDDAQQLYSYRNGDIKLKDIAEIISAKNNVINLKYNYRVPKAIAKFSGKIINDNGELFDKCVKDYGYEPKITKYKSMIEELNEIRKIITEESLFDVAILVPGNKDVKYIKKYFERINFEVEYKYNDRSLKKQFSNINYFSNLPKIMTYYSAKGLEFEYVFLPGCDEIKRRYNRFFNKESLYVACTRTKKRLYISYSNKLCKYIKLNEK